ncbi:MAG: hypothetical protein R3F17_12055 [Planctomycetota bacterium]
MRALLVILLAALTGIAGFWTMHLKGVLEGNEEQLREKDAQIATLTGDLAESEARRRQLEVANHLLKLDHRVARIEVLDQKTSEADPTRTETPSASRSSTSSGPLGEGQTIVVDGKKVYLETLTIKFNDEYVEGGDFLRGSSICLFQRVFGENQSPQNGTEIDNKGVHPSPYDLTGDGEQDLFYAELWTQFWEYANDPDAAREKGVRAQHGEAPFVETRPGKVYRVELRASGGLTIVPER